MNKLFALFFSLVALLFAPLAHAQYVPPASGWKLLGSNSLAGVSTAEFTSSTIGNSTELLFVIKNTFCGSSATSSYIYFGDGSSTFPIPANLQMPSCTGGGVGVGGSLYIGNSNGDVGSMWGAFSAFATTAPESNLSSWANTSGQVTSWRIVGGVKLVRFRVFGDTFTSGTVELYGR